MPKEKIESPQYMDWLYKNTGGKMGRPMQTPNIVPEIPKEAPRKYERPSNWLPKLLVGIGGGNPAFIDQIQAQNEENDAMNDPMSERSILARGIAKRLGANVGDSSSARDVLGYLPILEKLREMELRGKGGPKPLKFTESERAGAGFAARLAQSNKILGGLNAEDTKPEVLERLYTSLPFINSEAPSYLRSDNRQKAQQAIDNFINAELRRESGAAIGAPEYERANRQYFPMPGDTSEVIAQKRQNREQAEKNMIFSSGEAYNALNQQFPESGGNRVFTITDPKTGDSTQTSDPQLAEAARKRGAKVQ